MKWKVRHICCKVFLVASLVPCSCSLEDERDLCCNQVVMEYSYQPYREEAFSEYIQSLRHYLFDMGGNYIGEIPADITLTRQRLSLEAGDYTMVTVGNASANTLCECDPAEGLSDFSLSVHEKFEKSEEVLCNTDQLYWGVKEFTVAKSGQQRFVTMMNNIHCHLEVQVVWNNMPEYIGDYEMELSGVPGGYVLCPDSCSQVNGFVIPKTDEGICSHRLRVPLKSQKLYGEFITLRYTDVSIPFFRLWYQNKPITGRINLKKAFREWGWFPSRVHVQQYRIQLKVFGNGTVEVSPWIDTTIEDWVNGGTFG